MTNPTPPDFPGATPNPEPSVASASSKYVGKWLGKFQVVGELGRGGMGVVFEARDTVLDRHVAIKMLPRSFASKPENLERFLREARSAAKLHRPNIVSVHEANQCNGQYYIVLELVRGGSMQDAIRSGPLPWLEATRVAADACRGLEVAHRGGLVHRDIKPSNLMRSEDGTVKLADFGLARLDESNDASMTASGSVLGTPHFMSPEQCRSELANGRSDVYAMGATYYTLLTGQVPFPAAAPLLAMNAHLWNPIPDPRKKIATIPPACSAIIKKAMAKDPDDRYQDATQLLLALESVLNESHPTSNANETIHIAQPNIVTKTRSMQKQKWKLALFVGIVFATSAFVLWAIIDNRFRSSADGISKNVSQGKATPPNKKETPPPLLSKQASPPNTSVPTRKRAPRARPVVNLAESDYRLPGMIENQRSAEIPFASWSMDYPGISQASMSNSGEYLAVISNPTKGQIDVWNRQGKKLIAAETAGRAKHIAFSFDSSLLAVAMSEGKGLGLWDTKDLKGQPKYTIPDKGDVEAVAFSDDGRWLAFTATVSSTESAWVLWDLVSQKQLRRTTVSKCNHQTCIGFAPEDMLTVMTGGSDGAVRSWSGSTADKEGKPFYMGVGTHSIAIAPRRRSMAIGAGKYFVTKNYFSDKREHASVASVGEVQCVAFSPTEQQVAWSSGSQIECVDMDTHKSVALLRNSNADILSIEYTPDAKRIVTSSSDGKLTVWWMSPPPK